MKLIVAQDYEEMSQLAADIIKVEIMTNPSLSLGMATGSTPLGAYQELINFYEEGQLDFSRVRTFNLDEYVGLEASHPSSYRYYMEENLFKHINIKREYTHLPRGEAKDLERECRNYDELIARVGGIDLQILGVGTNGHIAFLEPSEKVSLNTSIIELTESTRRDNSRFFDSIDDVPRSALTMGMGTILKAKKIILMANGENKREVIRRLLDRDYVSSHLPVSFLMLHPDLTVIVDQEAFGVD